MRYAQTIALVAIAVFPALAFAEPVPAATPFFAPGGGTFHTVLSVEVWCDTEGAAIHYTTDGSEPTTSSASVASGEGIAVDVSMTLKAFAAADSFADSNVASADYVLACAAPTFSRAGGLYFEPIQVQVLQSPRKGTIHYTTNGDDPTETDPVVAYGGQITIDHDTILKARAFEPGWQPSPVTAAHYIISASPFNGGVGTAEDPFIIATKDDILLLSTFTERIYNKHFVMTADIDLSGHIFTDAVIGRGMMDPMAPGTFYRSVFDGNGHKITGLVINAGPSVTTPVGFFGSISGVSVVKRLTIENCSIAAASDSTYVYVGGLAGAVDAPRGVCYDCPTLTGPPSLIADCHVSGQVYGGKRTGGLVGWSKGEIVQCYSTAEVTGIGAGGLAGANVGPTIGDLRSGSIANSYATGKVFGGGGPTGSLVGYNDSAIKDCYAGDNSGMWLIGNEGINGTVQDCFWEWTISGVMPSTGGTSKTAAELKNINTFLTAGWDFETIWYIREGIDYPRLLWQLPTADAGLDQTLYADHTGKANVTLDGSASSDTEGEPLTYLWTWSVGGEDFSLADPNFSIELPVGTYTFTLVVNDGTGDSEPDTCTVTVVAPARALLSLTPAVINAKSRGGSVIAMMTIPGVTKSQLDPASRMTLWPFGLEAERQLAYNFGSRNRQYVIVLAWFDRRAILDTAPTPGWMPVAAETRLTDGRYAVGQSGILIFYPPKGK